MAARSAGAPASGQVMSAPAEPRARSEAQSPTAVQGLIIETPEQWLQRIARLRQRGMDEEADKALAEFRKRYPDYQMSAQMRVKVEKAVPASR